MSSSSQRYSLVLHVLFWIGSALFLCYFFGRLNGNYAYTFLYVLFQLPVIIATTYTINYWLVPTFLFRNRLPAFIYLLAACLIVSAWLNALITIFAITSLYQYNFEFLPPVSFDFPMLTAGLYLVILAGVAIHFARESLKQQRVAFEIKEKQTETELSLKESRLKLLRNQLHPHTLFNALNTAYGLSLKKSDEAPAMILGLSDMLDYMLYRCNEARIVLEKEIGFLKNYIGIERHRFAGDLALDLRWPDDPEDFLIAPLLLFPIVENCFKHTRPLQDGPVEIGIGCRLLDGVLHFNTRNSYNNGSQTKEKPGIGLQNVRERLELLYADRHSLNHEVRDGQYHVDLVLELEPADKEVKS